MVKKFMLAIKLLMAVKIGCCLLADFQNFTMKKIRSMTDRLPIYLFRKFHKYPINTTMKKNVLLIMLAVFFSFKLFGQPKDDSRIWAINCGYTGDKTFEGFIPDTFNIEGTALWNWGTGSISVEGVPNAAPAEVYETVRFEWSGADVEYMITDLTPNTTYWVRLHFGELSSDSGQRIFDIYLNDNPVEVGFDVFVENDGVAKRALIKEYEVETTSLGSVFILFTNVTVDNACINGIEIFSEEP
jgi:hypothetical protein